MHPFIQVRLTQRAAWLTWWVVTLPSREGGAGEGRSKSSNSQLNVANSKHSLSQHFPIDLLFQGLYREQFLFARHGMEVEDSEKHKRKWQISSWGNFYHCPHFLYRIGYWITYQIECLIKEIMFEWVRDNLQTMLDLEMWAHLKMNKKHQIKTLGALPCTFCPVISKIALYLSLCFFAGWVGFSLLPCHRLLKLLKTTPGGHLPRLHCSINWNLSEITILSKCAHWSLGQVHVKTLCFKVQAKLSQKVQIRGEDVL